MDVPQDLSLWNSTTNPEMTSSNSGTLRGEHSGVSQVSVMHARYTCSSPIRSQMRSVLLLTNLVFISSSQRPRCLSVCCARYRHELGGLEHTTSIKCQGPTILLLFLPLPITSRIGCPPHPVRWTFTLNSDLPPAHQ